MDAGRIRTRTHDAIDNGDIDQFKGKVGFKGRRECGRLTVRYSTMCVGEVVKVMKGKQDRRSRLLVIPARKYFGPNV